MNQKKHTFVIRRDNLEYEFMNLRQENAVLSEKLQFSQAVNMEYYNYNQNLKEELTTSKETVDLLKVRLSHLENKDKHDDLVLKLKSEEENSEKKSKEIEVYYGVIKQLESVLDDTNKSYTSLKQVLASKEEELSNVITELDNSKETLSQYEITNANLEYQLRTLLNIKNELDNKSSVTENKKIPKDMEENQKLWDISDIRDMQDIRYLQNYSNEIDKLHTCIILLNKSLAQRDEYIYEEEEVYRKQLIESNYDIESILKEKSICSEDHELMRLTKIVDETNSVLSAKTKYFNETIAKLEALLEEKTEQYNNEKIKSDALSMQVMEDYKTIRKLQCGIEAHANEETVEKKSLTRKMPLKPSIENEQTQNKIVNNLLEVSMHSSETNTELTLDNIELLFELEQNYENLSIQHSELEISYEQVKNAANILSRSDAETTSKIEKLSKENIELRETYETKLSELNDTIYSHKEELSHLSDTHKITVKDYEEIIEDLTKTSKKYEEDIKNLCVFKDENQELHKKIHEQQLELQSIKELQGNEKNIMELYDEELLKNEDLIREVKNLELNVRDNDDTIKMLNLKLQTISSQNENLIETEQSTKDFLKEQENTITELRNEKLEIENNFNDFKNALDQDYITHEEHNSVILRYKEEVKNLVDENTEYGVRENAYKETIEEYNNETQELNNTINSLTNNCNLLEEKLKEMQQKETEYIITFKKLENETEHAKYEVVKLQDEYSSRKRIMDDLMEDKQSLQAVMVALDNTKQENETYLKELQELRSLKETLTNKCEAQEDSIKILTTRCNEHEKYIENLKNTLSISEKSLNSMRERFNELGSKNKSSNNTHNMQLNELKDKLLKERSALKALEKDLNEIIEEKDTKLRDMDKELRSLQSVYDTKNTMLEKFQKSFQEHKEREQAHEKTISDYEKQVKDLNEKISSYMETENALHKEISALEEEKSKHTEILEAALKEQHKNSSVENIEQLEEELKKFQRKVEVQSSLIQKLRDSEKALRENDTLMQDDIKSIISEKEKLREEISKLKQLNNSVLMRVKKNSEEKQELEQSCETLKNTIIDYVETIKKMSKNEYDHAYLRSQIHHQEKNFAAFI